MTPLTLQPASLDIWDKKYRLKDKQGNPIDADVDGTFIRVAKALSAVERPEDQAHWNERFLWALRHGAIPAGRITSNAGGQEHKPATSLINCTVSGTIRDSMADIMAKATEAAMTLKAGCGIGYEFSTLRPKGAFVAGAGAYTSGPMSFMDIFDKMCFTVASAGGRRGAQMGTFDITHPDVTEFVRAKREDGRLRQFNLSLLITDGFMEAVQTDADWPLVFPVHQKEKAEVDLNDETQVIWREWPTHESLVVREDGLVACRIYKHIKAKRLWDVIMASTYDFAEPGFILIDKVNEMNNNWWCENIRATNPCVTGDTRILTRQGEVAIRDVVDQRVEVWNGERWSWVTPAITGRDQEMVRLTFSGGLSLTCTVYHGFFVGEGEDRQKVEARQLRSGQRLSAFRLPGDTEDRQVRIQSMEFLEDLEPVVYCFNEPERHAGVFNGVLTAQCGEQPLPPYGSCLLGSINLTHFVKDAFTPRVSFDWDTYREVVRIFTRMLDNVVELNGLPLAEQRHEIESKRRHGMGFLGLGSALTMMRVPYGSAESVRFTEDVTREMAIIGWEEAVVLAEEKSPAPLLAQEFTVTAEMLRKRPEMIEDGFKVGDAIRGAVLHARYSRYMQRLGEVRPDLIEKLEATGARFTHHTSIAPTGTISLSLANNASNGIEPSFAHHYSRNVIREGRKAKEKVEVYSYELLAYREQVNPKAMPFSKEPEFALPAYFIAADDVSPTQHVDIQAAAQKWVDSSISKTANVPTDYPYEDFKDIYLYAYHQGLKGCTTFRFNPAAFQGVLVKEVDLENTRYQFTLENGEVIELRGNEEVEYDGETNSAANLYDALKEGYYGKF
jgi:ribonucleotide reductase alpha subunit